MSNSFLYNKGLIRHAFLLLTGMLYSANCIYAGDSCRMIPGYSRSGKKSLFQYTGSDKSFDLGINWYMFKYKFKAGLHVVFNNNDFAGDPDNCNGNSFLIKI